MPLPHSDASPYRLAVLSYFPGLADKMRLFDMSGAYTLDYFTIQYDKPDLGAASLLERGYEVVLVYSSQAQEALERIGYSGVRIQRTDMDVIQALLEAKAVSDHIIFPVHAESFENVALLEQLCGVRLFTVSYTTLAELREGLLAAFAQGLRVVVGGGQCMLVAARQQGAACFPVVPSQYSFRFALHHALTIARAKRSEYLKHKQLLSILRLSDGGVLFVDSARRCVYSNDGAHKLLKHPGASDMNDFSAFYGDLKIDEVLETGRSVAEMLVTVNHRQLVVSTVAVSVESDKTGAVAFFRDVTAVHDFAGRIRASQQLLQGFVARHGVEDIRGEAPGMRRLREMIDLYAPHDPSVLIHGETGTGKDLVAQALHNASHRRNAPFVAINCAALPDTLLESELFGYEEGAFTGARRGGKAGVFEMAHTGTLFLDEVGDLGYNAQLRLLRVLETREVIRVGGNRVIPVDIRVISASHKPLAALVRRGEFRADLFYRLAVLRLKIPPLRQRTEDIPLLAGELLSGYGRGPESLTPGILEAMRRYAWPGNVRELKSVLESYLILLGTARADETLFFRLLEEWASEQAPQSAPSPEQAGELLAEPDAAGPLPPHVAAENAGPGHLRALVDAARADIVRGAVARCGGNRREAARSLGISYNTLWRILGGNSAGDAHGG